MIEMLKRIIRQYEKQNPVRTADVHPDKCECLRCVIDLARAHVAYMEKDHVLPESD